MPIAIAWHITFNTYGSWLPGDPRGFVDRKGPTLRTRIRGGDPDLHAYHRENLTHPEVRLDGKARRIVRVAIQDYCKFKQWGLPAINIRTNHVHVVVSGDQPSKMLNALKARATRLLREEMLFPPERPVWSERGSKHALYSEAAKEAAVHYVLYKQGSPLPEE